MPWYPQGFGFTPTQGFVRARKDRYVLWDIESKTVWKVYQLTDEKGKPLDENKKHFQREGFNNVRLLGSRHRNIRAIRQGGMDVYKKDGVDYGVLIFDYLPQCLGKVIWDSATAYNAADVTSAAFQLTEGIRHLHDVLGLTHRDIKPDNVLIDDDGALKITDFNIALWERSGSLHSATGTRRYMHPRQLFGGNFNDTDDLWSLGVLIWELVTRKKCFNGMSQEQLLEYRENKEFEVPPLEGEHWITQLIKRCCQETNQETAEWMKIWILEQKPMPTATFHTTPVQPAELRLPAGLEAVRIEDTPIYQIFCDNGTSMANQAESAAFSSSFDAVGNNFLASLDEYVPPAQRSTTTDKCVIS